jgi:hypothetical protein
LERICRRSVMPALLVELDTVLMVVRRRG